MNLKEKIALSQLKKELARGIISAKEYEVKLKKIQGIPIEPKEEIRAKVVKIVNEWVQQKKTKKAPESRPERIDTERVAELDPD